MIEVTKHNSTWLWVLFGALFVMGLSAIGGHRPAVAPGRSACTQDQFDINEITVEYVSGNYARLEANVRSRCADVAHLTLVWQVENPDGSYSRFPLAVDQVIFPNQSWPISTMRKVPAGQPPSTIEIASID